jgi:hypothetical protein
MVYFIDTPSFDFYKKRALLAFNIMLLSSAWVPIFKELFFPIMEFSLGGVIKVGTIVGIIGLIGAWGIYKRWF